MPQLKQIEGSLDAAPLPLGRLVLHHREDARLLDALGEGVRGRRLVRRGHGAPMVLLHGCETMLHWGHWKGLVVVQDHPRLAWEVHARRRCHARVWPHA